LAGKRQAPNDDFELRLVEPHGIKSADIIEAEIFVWIMALHEAKETPK